jgi:hypothetical protein
MAYADLWWQAVLLRHEIASKSKPLRRPRFQLARLAPESESKEDQTDRTRLYHQHVVLVAQMRVCHPAVRSRERHPAALDLPMPCLSHARQQPGQLRSSPSQRLWPSQCVHQSCSWTLAVVELLAAAAETQHATDVHFRHYEAYDLGSWCSCCTGLLCVRVGVLFTPPCSWRTPGSSSLPRVGAQ